MMKPPCFHWDSLKDMLQETTIFKTKYTDCLQLFPSFSSVLHFVSSVLNGFSLVVVMHIQVLGNLCGRWIGKKRLRQITFQSFQGISRTYLSWLGCFNMLIHVIWAVAIYPTWCVVDFGIPLLFGAFVSMDVRNSEWRGIRPQKWPCQLALSPCASGTLDHFFVGWTHTGYG